MPFLNTPEVRLHYEVYGEHNRGAPLVLAHGLGLTAALWAEQVTPLSQHRPLVLWEARGHGGSGLPDSNTYGLDASARDLWHLLNHLEIGKAHIGGLSLGGGTAVRFALLHPQRVTSLIVCDAATALPLEVSSARLETQTALLRTAHTGDMGAVAERVLEATPHFCLRAREPAIRERLIRMYRNVHPHAFAQTLIALREPSFGVDAVRALACPTLVIAGEHDAAGAVCRRFHNRVAGSVYVFLAEAGHLSNLDASGAFNGAMLEFLG